MPSNLTFPALADFIERLAPEKFNMAIPYLLDEPATCIGGWAIHLSGVEPCNLPYTFANILSISLNDAKDICFPSSLVVNDPYKATPQQAASLLRHYAATGIVDWPRAMEKADG